MRKFIIILLLFVSSAAFSQSMHGISYNIAFPLGETSDYIETMSWRGFTINGKYFLSDNMTLGWTVGWQTMYESETGTFTEGTQSYTGTQYRYLNILPIMATYNYFFGEDGMIQPFIGLGVGTYWIEKKTNIGFLSETDDNWHFGAVPEAGVMFPVGLRSNLYTSLRYNMAFESNDSGSHSYLGLNIGFLWY